jgi:7-cyano-7-deazaguanine reductase
MGNYSNSPLGKSFNYRQDYAPELLFPIPRKGKREEIGIAQNLPFFGADIWNAYELSWLNSKGKPIVGLAQIIVPCHSPNIIESKSLKLYFNSFNQTTFTDKNKVITTIKNDLSHAANADVMIDLWETHEFPDLLIRNLNSRCLDQLDISCNTYLTDFNFLKTQNSFVEETVYSDLLRSNCLVTGQPDWGTVEINYRGKKINHEGLLQYIVSFRNHTEFHEQCVERIFMDIMRQCSPEKLSVYARYTRRGGIDINPYRSTDINYSPANIRLCRQ